MPAGRELDDVPAELDELVRAAAREAGAAPGREHPHGAHGEPAARRRRPGARHARPRRGDGRHHGPPRRRPGLVRDRPASGRRRRRAARRRRGRIRETGMRPGEPAAVAELDRMLRPAPTTARRSEGIGRRRRSWTYIARQVDRLAGRGAAGPPRRARRRAPDAGRGPPAAQRAAGLPEGAGSPAHRPRSSTTCATSAASSPRPGTPRCCASASTPTSRRFPGAAAGPGAGPGRPGTSLASRRRHGPPC